MKGKIFNAQEVKAIIRADKTMFREAVKVQPPTYIKNVNFAGQGTWEWGNSGVYVEEPYQKGQKIFVKESFNNLVAYKQNSANAERYIWKPASQMKQEQSRLTLQIKQIRVERLKEISEEDAIAEGLDKLFSEEFFKEEILKRNPNDTNPWKNYLYYGLVQQGIITQKQSNSWGNQFYSAEESAKLSFASLWNATHEKEEHKWENNPWVWVIQFDVIKN
jgi:hypothetical protein